MRKFTAAVIIFTVFVFSLFYFELPFNLIRPVFHADEIRYYSKRYGLDPLLVTALIKVESNFLEKALSNKGAVGLMQLMPYTAYETARELGYKKPEKLTLDNPRVNIQLGTYYLSKLNKNFNGNLILTIAAYNAGKNKVEQWHKQNPMLSVEFSDIPYTETRNYVKNIMRTFKWLKQIQRFQNLIKLKKA